MNSPLLLLVSIVLICSLSATAQQSQKPGNASDSPATPQVERIWKAFGGDWDSTETMERSEFFPKGGSRSGVSHWRLGIGGTTLVDDGHSDGSAGPLDHLLIFWFDEHAKTYRLFVCFKDNQGSECKVRGTAHWEGNTFVNDYEETVKGKPVTMRDSFVDITPNSHTLVFAMDTGTGTMKTMITTRSVRRQESAK